MKRQNSKGQFYKKNIDPGILEKESVNVTQSFSKLDHRNIKTQGITTAETSVIKLDGFY